MISGIYKISNLVNNKIYVGSSVNLKTRFWDHRKTLRKNKHFNIYLQRAWNKYWEHNFRFEVIEYCEKEKLIEREQYWIDSLKACNKNTGYNISVNAGNRLGIKHPPRTEEYKKKLSIATKGIVKSEKWLNNIKGAILVSDKNFKNKRNFDKWPHDDGRRCKCKDCSDKRKLFMRNYYYKKIHHDSSLSY